MPLFTDTKGFRPVKENPFKQEKEMQRAVEANQCAHACLMDNTVPDCTEECAWCSYFTAIQGISGSTMVND